MTENKGVPCRICGEETLMLGTKLCDRCWEIETRVQMDPAIAIHVLHTMGLWSTAKGWDLLSRIKGHIPIPYKENYEVPNGDKPSPFGDIGIEINKASTKKLRDSKTNE